MPAFGGHCPFPRRLGGGLPRVKAIQDSLMSQMGSAYAKEDDAYVVARAHAIARMISASWGDSIRLSHVADPWRMPKEIVPRWETALSIVPPHDADMRDRRTEIDRRFARGKKPTRQLIYDLIVDLIGDAFVDLYYIPLEYAVIHTPDSTYGFGSVVENPYGVLGESAPWYSTIAHVLIHVEKPAAMTEGEFRALMGEMRRQLDPIFSSWSTFDWYRAPSVGTPIDVPGGPQNTGFYLDEPNLDNLVFAPFPEPGVAGFFLDVEHNLDRLEFA